jgi:two-component system, NarL family, sensor kinase
MKNILHQIRLLQFAVSVGLIVGCGNSDSNQNSATGSKNNADSIRHQEDSLLVLGLLDEAWKWQSVNSDSCIVFAKQALSLAQKYGLKSMEAEAYCRIGSCEEKKDNYDSAIENYTKAFHYDSVSLNSHGMARDNYQLGIVLKKQGKYKEALTCSMNALGIWEKIPDKKINLANACISIGNIHNRQGEFDLALAYFFRSLDTAKATNSAGLIADSYNSIGLVYENQSLYDRALEMYMLCLALEEQRKNQRGIALSYNNIGNVYYHKNNFDESLNWYLKSIEIKERLGLTQNAAGTYNNVGLIYGQLGDHKKALDYHLKSLAIRRTAEDPQGIATSLNNIGTVYLNRGDQKKAIGYLKESFEIAEKSGSQFILMEILKNLSQSYASNSDFSTAFSYTRRYQTIRDSLENHFRKATETDISYREEKSHLELLKKEQEKQIAELESNRARDETQSIIVYSLLIVIGLLILLFFVFWSAKKRVFLAEQEKVLNEQKIEGLIRNQELNTLRTMLETQEKERKRMAQDLHDQLGIKLSTAKLYYGLIGKKIINFLSQEEQDQFVSGNTLLDEASDELREIAHSLVSGQLMKFGLVLALENLCKTVSTAGSFRIDFQAHGMDDRLNIGSEHTLYLIIQELLTNILKHAKAHEVGVQLNRYNHTLNVLIDDDGIGFDSSDSELKSGIGLKNISERVKQINGTLHIDSAKGRGTTISIDIVI